MAQPRPGDRKAARHATRAARHAFRSAAAWARAPYAGPADWARLEARWAALPSRAATQEPSQARAWRWSDPQPVAPSPRALAAHLALEAMASPKAGRPAGAA